MQGELGCQKIAKESSSIFNRKENRKLKRKCVEGLVIVKIDFTNIAACILLGMIIWDIG